MATLTGGSGSGTRVAAGALVLARAKQQDTKTVKDRLAAFAAAHAKYAAAEAKVSAADDALGAAQQKVADADVTQDDAVEALAKALVGDGHKRDNPFKQLGYPSPSVVAKQGYGDEAKTVTALAAKVAKTKGLSKTSLAAADAAKRAAAGVTKLLPARDAAEAARKKAQTARDALAQPWETAFAALKRGAKAAADEGAPALFQALFASSAPAHKRAPKRPPSPPAPPPVAPAPPAPPVPPTDGAS
jgi:hypothetical protein